MDLVGWRAYFLGRWWGRYCATAVTYHALCSIGSLLFLEGQCTLRAMDVEPPSFWPHGSGVARPSSGSLESQAASVGNDDPEFCGGLVAAATGRVLDSRHHLRPGRCLVVAIAQSLKLALLIW